MFDCHPGKFSKTGGKCLTLILANFQKWVENVRPTSFQIFKNGRKMSNCHSDKFSKMGGKSLAEITSEGGKTTRNKICWVGILLGESSLGSI